MERDSAQRPEAPAPPVTPVSEVATREAEPRRTPSADTLAADTLAADTLHRVRRYRPARGLALFPSRPEPDRGGPQRTTGLLAPRSSFWMPSLGERYEHRLALDSTSRSLTARSHIGEEEAAPPLRVDRRTYRRGRLQRDLRTGWTEISRERRQRERRDGGLGLSINVPGGRESAFTTIFGKNEVSLDINGQANIDAGFNYRRSDQQAQLTGSPTQIDPDFKQDLRLGITGSIGDKLRIDVNWDTQSQFDYQNQVKLRYTGYEDEIIQRVEAGNVFLDTPSRLIDGGQSLFGIKSQFQLGGLRLTTIASQQEGQSNSLSIEGGATRTEFDRSARDYDERRHFFLGYYFRNSWEPAHANPQALRIDIDRITELQVWRSKQPNDQQTEQVTALVDLGEPPELLAETNDYNANGPSALPDSLLDRYTQSDLQALRAGDPVPAALGDFDYQRGDFKRLTQNDDYNYNQRLGYLSLRQRLQDDEALAVAFRYRTSSGEIRQIGDFEGEEGGQRLVLKLLRPGNLKAAADEETAAWYLQMRNIYELRGRNIDAEGFELGLQFQPTGSTAQTTLQELGGQATLLQLLGLDRQDADGTERADGRFDFNGRTIKRDEGLLVFPYLQPFGSRLRAEIEERAPDGQAQALADRYGLDALAQLYLKKPNTLQEATERSEIERYRITGSSKGSAQQFYDLRAFNGVVEGSVTVTAGGAPLSEGVDYQVDYQGGTVTITNDSYLGPGTEINIDYERNALVNLQKKTLLGARADYRLRDNLRVGATLMRLSQRSPADKLRLGQEPIKNTIWGLDAALELQPRWLTRAMDALPLVQTRSPSALELNAEFAQLRPGHTDTQAFERTQRNLPGERGFAADELGGISYIDDFEGFENSFSLKSQVQNWRLAAAPDQSYEPPLTGAAPGALAANNWRGGFAWYQLNNNIVEELRDVPAYDNQLKQLVDINDVFPDRDTRGQVNSTLRTLDLYFDPQRRGPYNYTEDLRGFLGRPQDTWGGMTQRLPAGQKDFGVKNIEFVEFVFKASPEGGVAADSAALYLDLGRVSEDILPNREENDEDGLSLTGFDNLLDRSRLPVENRENRAVDIEGGVTEDLGLDGLASYTGVETYGPAVESAVFADFLDQLPPGGEARLRAEVARAQLDPSGDNYRFYEDDAYFEDPTLFPSGASFQERFLFYRPGTELNSYQAQNTLSDEFTSGRGNTRDPDSENFDFDQLNTSGNYFQYRIPLNKEVLDELARPNTPNDFIVGEIQSEGGEGTGWYQARIPVEQPSRSVGSPDLNFVEHMRLWTTGHRTPMTLRLASLELVGSQWRASENIRLVDEPRFPQPPDRPGSLRAQTEDDNGDGSDDDGSGGDGSGGDGVGGSGNAAFDDSRLTITSINNEEDSGIYQRPRRAVVGQQQVATGGRQNSREQSLVLRVEELRQGQKRAIFKNVQNLNLLQYGGLRLFTHLHSATGDFAETFMNEEQARAHGVELFVRVGANETQDYYEYRQPLTPTLGSLAQAPVERLWYPLDAAEEGLANEMNLRISALNQLKVARDQSSTPPNRLFWSDRNNGNPDDDIPLDPALGSFAPQGSRLAVKGTPSLQNVSTIVIGVRAKAGGSPDSPARNVYEDLTLWVNELRATDYDERSGWKATASARVELADLAEVRANFERQTDGWGELASTLGGRRQNQLLNWSVRTTLYADKLLPSTAGWQIPVTIDLGSETSTPRYAPNRGDVLLSDVLALAPEEPGRSRSTLRRAAQTRSTSSSINVRLSKSNSASPWMNYTLDNLNFSYNFSQSDAQNPSRQIDDGWQWNADLEYRYDFQNAHTVRPFGFLQDLPLVGGLGNLRFNYAPQSVNFYGGASRNTGIRQDRPNDNLLFSPSAGPSGGGSGLREPIRDTHVFNHERRFGLRHNPFEFMRLAFNTRTTQSLNDVGRTERISVVTPDSVYVRDGEGDAFDSDAEANTFAETTFANNNYFVEQRLDMFGPGQSLRRLFGGRDARTNRYIQEFSASFDVPFGESEALNWITFDDVSYDASYEWQNGARGGNLGAGVGNDVNVTSGITLHPQNFWRKFGFYRRLEEQQEEAERAAAAPEGVARPGGDRDAPVGRSETADDEAADDEAGDSPAQEGSPAEDDSTTEEGNGDPAGGTPSLSDLPLPNPVNLLRRLALAVTGMRDFSVKYDATRSAQSSNVGVREVSDSDTTFTSGSHTLLGAFQGEGPSLGYRFGFGRRIRTGLRLNDEQFPLEDQLNDSNRLTARTTLDFSDDLQVQLNWSMQWTKTSTYSNLRAEGGDTRTLNGSGGASVWAFGGGYRSFVERQLDRLSAPPSGDAPASGEAPAATEVALTNASISEDFRQSFSSSLGQVGESGFLSLPLPAWRVSYSGLSDWPLLRAVTQSVRLTHAYDAEYTSDFQNLTAEETGSNVQLGPGSDYAFDYQRRAYEGQRLSVQERFQPLMGLEVGWKGALRTNVEWKQANTFFTRPAREQVVEDHTSEVSFSIDYRKQGLSLSFLPFLGDLSNQITFSLTAARTVQRKRDLLLRNALEQAAQTGPSSYDASQALEGDNISVRTESTRLQLTPKLSYRFSNRISADFVLRYEQFEGNRTPSYSNIDGGFNVRMSLQE